ncbi:MAG TPA: malto-oligosyltrehalose synthase [Acidimicrobiales bacterium]
MDGPRATYRLQLTPGFGFGEAAEVAGYLARLGVSHAYLSPVLQAAPGSTHGYDVVDHSKASDALGGEHGFRALVASLRDVGLGVVLDVVPNHMAAALPENRWWWDVLENGPSSFWGSFFDIDWDPPEATLRNRVLLPLLGQRYGRALEAGEVTLAYEEGSFTIRYFEHVLPVAPRSLDRLLADAARQTASPELGFLADALGELPLAWVTDRASVRRRHRDKGVLLDRVAALYRSDPGVAAAVDTAIATVNKDPEILDALLERQNYRLAFWRTADQQLDYRRFFDIDTLVALRVEEEEVLEETHAHVFEWVASGLVDGLRIDHIDGLAAPERYLRTLEARTGGAWVVVEKILESGERLPASWPVAGTTGYDFLNVVARLFVDAAGEAPLTAVLETITGDASPAEEVIRAGKELIVDTSLAADVNRLVERTLRLAEQSPGLRDVTRADVHAAVRALVVAFPVYRTYGSGRPADAADLAVLERAAADVRARAPEVDDDVLGFLVDLLAGRSRSDAGRVDVARRFEQLTGPVMAKGVEDTAFYRYLRLIALNEVGSDLGAWAITPAQWHERAARMAAGGDGSLLATSTHDTKRGEDVRARLVLLSEIPAKWAAAVAAWSSRAGRYRTRGFPDPDTEYLLFQTLVGAWPLSVERALEYARKATREAKVHTSWTDPDPAFDDAVEGWLRGVLADPELTGAVEGLVAGMVEPGRVVSLAQALCKLTAPGVPDLYQGTELWDLSLVDPDNRRPVDYDVRSALLAEIERGDVDAAAALSRSGEGLPKLLVTTRALHVRRARPESFAPGAGYTALDVVGPAAAHVVAYGRGPSGAPVDVVTVIPRLVLRWAARPDGWGGTTVVLPPGTWRNVFTGAIQPGGPAEVAGVLGGFPVALLERGS